MRNDDRRRTRKYNQQETTYVTMTGEGRASNIMETKERGLDWPAVGDIATGAIWWRSVKASKRRGRPRLRQRK